MGARMHCWAARHGSGHQIAGHIRDTHRINTVQACEDSEQRLVAAVGEGLAVAGLE
jgi:hypothetical protein